MAEISSFDGNEHSSTLLDANVAAVEASMQMQENRSLPSSSGTSPGNLKLYQMDENDQNLSHDDVLRIKKAKRCKVYQDKIKHESDEIKKNFKEWHPKLKTLQIELNSQIRRLTEAKIEIPQDIVEQLTYVNNYIAKMDQAKEKFKF